MSISYVGSSYAINDSPASTIPWDFPAGTQAGDCYAFLGIQVAPSAGGPPGFSGSVRRDYTTLSTSGGSPVVSSNGLIGAGVVETRDVGPFSSPAHNQVAPTQVLTKSAILVSVFRGVDFGTVIDNGGGPMIAGATADRSLISITSPGGQTVTSVPALTTVVDNTMLVAFGYCADQTNTWTQPGGWTEDFDCVSDGRTFSGFGSHKLAGAAGSTGTMDFTRSVATDATVYKYSACFVVCMAPEGVSFCVLPSTALITPTIDLALSTPSNLTGAPIGTRRRFLAPGR